MGLTERLRRPRQESRGTGNEPPPIVREEIARIAYQLFEQRGRVHGHDWEDWLRAEQIVRQRRRSDG